MRALVRARRGARRAAAAPGGQARARRPQQRRRADRRARPRRGLRGGLPGHPADARADRRGAQWPRTCTSSASRSSPARTRARARDPRGPAWAGAGDVPVVVGGIIPEATRGGSGAGRGRVSPQGLRAQRHHGRFVESSAPRAAGTPMLRRRASSQGAGGRRRDWLCVAGRRRTDDERTRGDEPRRVKRWYVVLGSGGPRRLSSTTTLAGSSEVVGARRRSNRRLGRRRHRAAGRRRPRPGLNVRGRSGRPACRLHELAHERHDVRRRCAGCRGSPRRREHERRVVGDVGRRDGDVDVEGVALSRWLNAGPARRRSTGARGRPGLLDGLPRAGRLRPVDALGATRNATFRGPCSVVRRAVRAGCGRAGHGHVLWVRRRASALSCGG